MNNFAFPYNFALKKVDNSNIIGQAQLIWSENKPKEKKHCN